MSAANMHRELQTRAALRACELSLSKDEQSATNHRMYALGWDGRSPVFAGVMANILREVAPMKLDAALRNRLLIGHFEDVQ